MKSNKYYFIKVLILNKQLIHFVLWSLTLLSLIIIIFISRVLPRARLFPTAAAFGFPAALDTLGSSLCICWRLRPPVSLTVSNRLRRATSCGGQQIGRRCRLRLPLTPPHLPRLLVPPLALSLPSLRLHPSAANSHVILQP